MNLTVPGVGTEGGPEYAEQINTDLGLIDQHSHLPGSGVPITAGAINVDGDIAMNGFNLTSTRALRLNAQDTPLVEPLDLTCVYVSGADLYYNDATGTPVRITQNGAIAGTPGSIADLVSPASASYVGANSTFVWESNVNTPAAMDNGPVTIRNLTANSFGMTVQIPSALGSDFTLTLPQPPAATSFMTMANTGVMSATGIPVTQGISLSMLALALQQAFCPTGSVLAYAGTSAPSGFLACEGSAVSRVTYAGLFAIIGTTHGQGDGSTTFNLPDYRGRLLRGVTGGSNLDPDAASRTAMATGGNTGNNVGSVQGHSFQTHDHSVRLTVNNALAKVGDGSAGVQGGASFPVTSGSSDSYVTTASGAGANSQASANETRPVNAYVNFIIKT